MTEKRFTYEEHPISFGVYDKSVLMNAIEIADLLNELSEENEQLEQFKNTVFDCINKKIEEVDTIGAEVLKDLRRELME